MVEVKGLHELHRNLEELQLALESLHGTIAEIPINPSDPASVEKAVEQMEAAVDRKVAPYGNNKMVAVVIRAAKDEYRKALLARFDTSQ
jgi:hypothetical protein